MASTRMSPGGALLRASRVFAIPTSLPRPNGKLSSQAVFGSDTATLPHPIHQSITTPTSSLAKGDWGFKRPLPLRATMRTSTPVIRVEAIDTFEHITEFNSAADHTLTLQKWQEMNIPISTPKPSRMDQPSRDQLIPRHRSVFEDTIDSTVVRNDDLNLASIGQGSEDTRWKFSGPWLAGLTKGEFQKYMANEVGTKVTDFRQFLRECCALNLTSEAREKARAEASENVHAHDEGLVNLPNITYSVDDISEEQLSSYIRRVRRDPTMLNRQVRAFLDLAPSPAPKPDDGDGDVDYDILGVPRKRAVAVEVSTSPYAESGPPKTHPSAGLSYGRSSSWIYNHALYGPQQYPPPIEARIVMPKNAHGSHPVLGVGGVVANIPMGFPVFDLRPGGGGFSLARPSEPIGGLLYVEPEKIGGSKTYVELKHAFVNAKGNMVLSVVPADKEAVAVKEDRVDEIPERLARPYVPAARLRPQTVQKGSGEGYGLW
ncbi:hypothetical protein SBOR_5658 [Sclerotinia borealis F-4128]|uniref:37S ribosomal protein mrp51, mitochondrial n=1 Tax=Sclerotinia borealis (strain F-4128) TaxID=1432307 RepID=W9CHE7_SCLBF|nr:hypothetical protein SBOR_5658 [Sclerotinia borealis F-4128]